jgi:hypothetical protein
MSNLSEPNSEPQWHEMLWLLFTRDEQEEYMNIQYEPVAGGEERLREIEAAVRQRAADSL